MRVSAPSQTSGLSPLRCRSTLMRSNARRSSLVAATAEAGIEAVAYDRVGAESRATRRARSRGETSGEEVESRRATGRCWVCRSEDFAVPVPFAKDVEAARPKDDKSITACDALQRRAHQGNRLENIGGTPRKTIKPGPEEAFKLTRRGASGQPVGNCKTQFSRRQL